MPVDCPGKYRPPQRHLCSNPAASSQPGRGTGVQPAHAQTGQHKAQRGGACQALRACARSVGGSWLVGTHCVLAGMQRQMQNKTLKLNDGQVVGWHAVGIWSCGMVIYAALVSCSKGRRCSMVCLCHYVATTPE